MKIFCKFVEMYRSVAAKILSDESVDNLRAIGYKFVMQESPQHLQGAAAHQGGVGRGGGGVRGREGGGRGRGAEPGAAVPADQGRDGGGRGLGGGQHLLRHRDTGLQGEDTATVGGGLVTASRPLVTADCLTNIQTTILRHFSRPSWTLDTRLD